MYAPPLVVVGGLAFFTIAEIDAAWRWWQGSKSSSAPG